MAKLTPDYIKFALSLSTTEAQEEMHKLGKSSKELKEDNKRLQDSMVKLIAEGKRSGKEYTNLEKQYKKNSKTISENNEKIKLLQSSMAKSEKSYAQLAKEARNLQKQLDNTVKSLNPQEYDRLQKELKETKEAMSSLRGGTNETGRSFLSLSKMKSMVIGFFMGIGSAAVGFLKDGIAKTKEFVAESMKIATQADGILHAFQNLDRPDLLANLRTATKNTVSDLELMKASVQAKDFRIPLDDLGKYLQFAQLKAQQTGQSVDYMTNSIVTGLGRKSLMILDNLGLSAAEINEEIKKTGNFMTAVANIIDRQLAASDLYVSAADRAIQADTKMENAKLKLGKRLSWLSDWWVNLKNKMADTINTTISSANDKFYEQKERVVSLYSEYMPLLNRYDELKAKTKLSSGEQAELNSIITKITENIPGVITKVGEYGEALELSSGKARDFIQQQKVLLEYMNREAIKEEESNLDEYKKKYQNALKAQQSGGVYVTSSMSATGYSTSFFDNSPQTLQRIDADVKKYGDMIKGAELRIQELRGDSLEKTLEDNEKRKKARAEFIKMNEKQLETWLADEKNASDEYRSIAEQVLTDKKNMNSAPDDSKYNSLLGKKDKITELDRKQFQERQRKLIELENQLTQSKINAMADGYEKEQEQRKLDNKKEIQALQRQKEDYIQAVIQAEKDVFDAKEDLKATQDQQYKKKTFNASSVSVDVSAFDEMAGYLNRKQLMERVQQAQQSWNEYLVAYGTFQEKRQAITELYNQRIEKAESKGEKASLQQEFSKKLKEIDFEEFKKSISFADIFGNLDALSTDALYSLRDKLKEYINRAADELRPEDLKSLSDALLKIDLKAVEKNPLKALGTALDEYVSTSNEVELAQMQLNQVLKMGSLIVEEYDEKTGKITHKLLTQADAEKNLSDAQKKHLDAQTKLSQSLNGMGKAGQQIVTAGNDIVNSLTNLGIKVPESVQGTLDGIGQVASGLANIDVTKPLSVLTSATGILSGITKTIGSIFGLGSGADYSEYDEMVAKYDTLLEIWDELLNKKKAYIKESYGTEATKAGAEALNIAKNELEVQKKLAEARLGAGSSAGSHSQWYRMWKGSYKWEGKNWRDVAGQISKEYDVQFNEMKDMINMSPEVLQSIKENYAGLWSVMDGEFREHLENIIQYGETEKDILQAVKEQITGISYDSFEDSYMDMLSDLTKENEDFAEDFEKKLEQSIIKSMMAEKYKTQIKKLYDTWADYADGGYTKEEVDALRDMQKDLTDAMLEEREQWAKVFGFSSTSDTYSQSSTSKGFSAMSQEQGYALEGRFTAVYESNLRIETQTAQQNATLLVISVAISEMVRSMALQMECCTEIKDVLHSCNDHLDNIEKYTKELSDMNETLIEIEKNTKQM